MSATTVKSTNLLIQKNEKRINAKVPAEMKRLIQKEAGRNNMTESQYIRISVQNQLIRDLSTS